jgi:hypothetical protein
MGHVQKKQSTLIIVNRFRGPVVKMFQLRREPHAGMARFRSNNCFVVLVSERRSAVSHSPAINIRIFLTILAYIACRDRAAWFEFNFQTF